jgi:hypothetical protein
MDATLSLAAFVVSILTIVAVLCPPISSFVALGLALAGGILFAATLIYQGVTRPNVFKLTWGSLDGWGGFLDRLKSKFYGWRLEKAKEAAYSLEQRIAPTCFKIAILERLLLKEVSNKKELLSLIGFHVTQQNPTEVKAAIQEQMDHLQKEISPRDRKSLSSLKARIQDLTQKAKIVDEKLDAIKKRMAQACEQDNRELMKKTNEWKNLKNLLDTFKEGLAERLEDGDEMCVTILEELHESTGIHFDKKKMQEALVLFQKDKEKCVTALLEPHESIGIRFDRKKIEKSLVPLQEHEKKWVTALQELYESTGIYFDRKKIQEALVLFQKDKEKCVTALQELYELTGIRFDRKKIEEALVPLQEHEKKCVTALQELYELTGIRFDRKKIEEALVPLQENKNHQNLLDAIGEPISQLLARTEGHLKEIPALIHRKKQ